MIGVLVLLSGSLFANTVPIRGSSHYGSQSNIDTGIGFSGAGFQEEVVCDPLNSSPGFVMGACSNFFNAPVGYDLLLAITSDTSVGNPFTITLPSFIASATNGVGGGYSFGVLECDLDPLTGGFVGNAPITLGTTTFCTQTQMWNGSSLVPTGLSDSAATCQSELGGLANGTDSITISGTCITNGMSFYFDESQPNTIATPEPGTLVLLGTGLLALTTRAAKRRIQA
jgi:hypothetical protein